jgi:small-conductance mechanosensitive channel
MEHLKLQIIETAVAIGIYILIKILLYKYINTLVGNSISSRKRSKIVKKGINLTTITLFLIILLSIWGVNQSELAVFIGSVLTVIGIALFAQWSILSNVTSGIILFFSHSAQLDDWITIMDKEYDIEGRISDIGLFFVTLKSKENDSIEIPNSVFLYKMIKKKKVIPEESSSPE